MAPTYFGFYGNGYEFWGDAIDQTRGFSNLNFLNGSSGPLLADQLERTRANGQRAIISVGHMLFESPSTVPKELYLETFTWWWEDLRAKDVVVALLLADEPFRTNDKWVKLPPAVVHHNLNNAATFVKLLTGKAVCMSASGPEYDQWGVPTDMDWVGMYRYSYNTHWLQLMGSFLNLVRLKRKQQKIMAVVDAYADDAHPIDESRIKAFDEWWKTLVNGYYGSDVVAVCPFLYQSTKMGDTNVWGAASMPRVLAELQGWGMNIMRSASSWAA